jgi:hypothetical protein
MTPTSPYPSAQALRPSASALTPNAPRAAARAATPRALAAFAALAALSACGNPQPWERADPTEAARAFLVALAFTDHATAWAMLDDATRADLTARADALRALPGAVERPPASLLNPGHVPYSAAEIKAVEAQDVSPEAATVRVSLHDGRAFSIPMRRLDGRWRVSLPPPAPLPSPAQAPAP